MKKHSIALTLIAGLLVGGSLWVWPRIRAAWPAIGPQLSISPVPSGNEQVSSGPLTPSAGWTVSLLVDKIPGARDMALDQFGNIWVSQTSEGKVAMVELSPTAPPKVVTVLKGLRKPHGLVFDPAAPSLLYVAQETNISRLPTYSDGGLEKIADLPAGGRHFTRSLAFGADARLYVSLGSTCDVCEEKNSEIATVISMKSDGTDRRTVSRGLRNAVFLANRPGTKEIWTTEMGRDNLGDNLPPDELNIIQEGKNFGWPICYGNRIHDAQFDTKQYIRDPCEDTEPPVIEIPAHSAPLGLAFLSENDVLVAYHGSWNRSVPTGYKIARWQKQKGTWVSSDFLTGFLVGSSALGRPADVLAMPDGSVLVSDDKSGSIWKVSPK